MHGKASFRSDRDELSLIFLFYLGSALHEDKGIYTAQSNDLRKSG